VAGPAGAAKAADAKEATVKVVEKRILNIFCRSLIVQYLRVNKLEGRGMQKVLVHFLHIPVYLFCGCQLMGEDPETDTIPASQSTKMADSWSDILKA
jgi:hypothetical protein